jgi:hypothetical protein
MVEGENKFLDQTWGFKAEGHEGWKAGRSSIVPTRGGQRKSQIRIGRGWGDGSTNGGEFIGQRRLDCVVLSERLQNP